MVEASARSRGETAEERLLALFDVVDDLFNRADREARAFVEVLGEIGRGLPLNDQSAAVQVEFRTLIVTLAVEAELRNVDDVVQSWRILMIGSILRAMAGDLEAAQRSRSLAADLITRNRVVTPGDTLFDLDLELALEGYAESADRDVLSGSTSDGSVDSAPTTHDDDQLAVTAYLNDLDAMHASLG